VRTPVGIAVNAAGDVYVAEKGLDVVRLNSRGLGTLVANVNASGGLAVDAAGGMLIAATYEVDRLRPDGVLVRWPARASIRDHRLRLCRRRYSTRRQWRRIRREISIRPIPISRRFSERVWGARLRVTPRTSCRRRTEWR